MRDLVSSLMRPVPDNALVTVVLETPQALARCFVVIFIRYNSYIFLLVNMYTNKMFSKFYVVIKICVLVYALIVY